MSGVNILAVFCWAILWLLVKDTAILLYIFGIFIPKNGIYLFPNKYTL